MSLRDELPERLSSGYRSSIDLWLESQTKEFQQEFIELVKDSTVSNTQLYTLARNYNVPTLLKAFTDWRSKVVAGR